MNTATDKNPASQRVIINPDSIPHLPRHVKLRYNEPRQQWVILAPEKLLVPDDISVAILQICDGKNTVTTIIDQLAEQYQAPYEVISTDVTALLQDLTDKGFIIT